MSPRSLPPRRRSTSRAVSPLAEVTVPVGPPLLTPVVGPWLRYDDVMPGSRVLEPPQGVELHWESATDDEIIEGMGQFRYDLMKATEVRDKWSRHVEGLKLKTLAVERAYDARKTRRLSLFAASSIRALRHYLERERQLEIEILEVLPTLPPPRRPAPRLDPFLEPTGLVRQCLDRHGRTSAPEGCLWLPQNERPPPLPEGWDQEPLPGDLARTGASYL